MSSIRVPTARAKLTNNDKVNPARWRKQMRDMEPDPLGPLSHTPPDWMDKGQQRYYREIVARCHKDVLCVADVTVVCMAACLSNEFEETQGTMNIARVRTLSSLMDKLGMSPSARSKVQAVNRMKKEKSPLDEFNS